MASSSRSLRRIGAAAGLREIRERHRVEVVVGERDEAEALPPQRHDFADDGLDVGLPRLLSIGAPHGAEGAVLRATAHRLHRGPHVAILRQQIPAGLAEVVPRDPARLVHALLHAGDTVVDHRAERVVAVAADHGVGAAEIVRLVRKERCVDAAEYDLGPALTRGAPDLVATQRIARVDADADDVARLHLLRVERLERLVADDGIPEARRRRGREHEEPARRDDGGAERDVAWVHEKHAHSGISRLMVDGGGDAWARARSELPGDRLARAGERAADRNAAPFCTGRDCRCGAPLPRRATTERPPAPIPAQVARAQENHSS